MPKLTQSLPKYRKHRSSGQAIVTLSGRDYYLGPHGSKASKQEYDRLIAEWLAAGRRRPDAPKDSPVTVMEVINHFWRHARVYYVKQAKPTSEQLIYRGILKDLKQLYGRQLAEDFGPLALKALRQVWIDRGHSRETINKNVRRVVHIFRWATSEEIIPPAIHQALKTVQGLAAGRSKAKESDGVKPVDVSIVEATIPHLSSIVADMVRLQLLTGMRPQEVCKLRPCDVTRDGEVWEYTVPMHKTEHRGKSRTVLIGPAAQQILAKYLLRDEKSTCFSPLEAVKHHLATKKERRVTPLNCGNRPGSNRKRNPKRKARNAYDTDSYRRAIARACDRAFPAPEGTEGEQLKAWQKENRWAPNRLRHTKATEIRRNFGIDCARVILGHSDVATSEIYAELDLQKAREVARKIG